MAYATGTNPASCSAILQALATFCTSYGWTVDYNAAYSGTVWALSIHKGSCYLNFVVPTGDGQIKAYGATGYSSGSAPSAQANTNAFAVITNPGQTSSAVNPGPYAAYHFFASSSSTYLHIVIEVTTGVFAHMHAGALNSAGGAAPCIYLAASNWYRYNSTGGGDSFASSPDGSGNHKPFCSDYANNLGGQSNTQMYCTVDGTGRWFAAYNGTSPARLASPGYSGYGNPGWQRAAFLRSPNTFNGVAPMIPIPFFAERAVGNIYSFVGDAPDIRFVNMKNNNAKDEITIGSDTWKLFPVISNSPTINTGGAAASSYPYGLAFLKSA